MRSQELVLRKVPGEVNPADMLTKGLPPTKLDPLMHRASQFSTPGEAAARVQLHMLEQIDQFVASLEPHGHDLRRGDRLISGSIVDSLRHKAILASRTSRQALCTAL